LGSLSYIKDNPQRIHYFIIQGSIISAANKRILSSVKALVRQIKNADNESDGADSDISDESLFRDLFERYRHVRHSINDLIKNLHSDKQINLYSKGEWFIPKDQPAMTVNDTEVIMIVVPEEVMTANDDKMNIYSLLNLQIPGFEKLKQNSK